MKKILLLITACLAFSSCGMNGKNENAAKAQDEMAASSEKAVKDHVEVLYFHGKQRCATCIAIEKNAKEAVETNFGEQVAKGDVVFRIIDINKDENKSLAEKHEVTWSSLIIVKYKDGKETSENITDFAFQNARNSPEEFKAGVVKTINEMLK